MHITLKAEKPVSAAEHDHFYGRTLAVLIFGLILFGICFCGPAVGQETKKTAPQSIDWSRTAEALRGQDGARFSFRCPANGTISDRLWGTDVYTDDSSICTAAVHYGLITPASGGIVTLQIIKGQEAYRGTRRNEVTSQDYGEWSGSFVFVRYYD